MPRFDARYTTSPPTSQTSSERKDQRTMVEQGKAAVFLGPGKGYEIRQFDVPDPEPDAIVIKISMSGICGSDLHIWRGDSPVFAAMAGGVVGHEMTGRVAKLGAKISTHSLCPPLHQRH